MIDRIQKIMDEEKLSPSQFADEINVQRSSLSHVLSGRNKPSLDFVIKIKKCFDRVNLDWLIFGTGQMYEKIVSDEKDFVSQKAIIEDQTVLKFETENVLNEKISPVIEKESTSVEEINQPGYGTKVVKLLLLYDNGKFEEYKK